MVNPMYNLRWKDIFMGEDTEEDNNCLRRADVYVGVAHASLKHQANQAEPLDSRLSA